MKMYENESFEKSRSNDINHLKPLHHGGKSSRDWDLTYIDISRDVFAVPFVK